MDKSIPTSLEVRNLLTDLGHAQIQELATSSGVPFTTLWKIKTGETDNPRLETVRQFFYLLKKPELAKKRKQEA